MNQPASDADITIRPATADDVRLLVEMIRELAEYERLAHEAAATEESLREHLFGSRPAAEALIAELDGRPVGYAIYFTNFSSFTSRPGIYLEDIYVQPALRGHGVGKRLLTEVAKLAVVRGCTRLEWAVLDWNTPSIEFYKKLGARAMSDWTTYRLTGDDLKRLGRGE
jgi:GNAT superfamily N-acetyltransferase